MGPIRFPETSVKDYFLLELLDLWGWDRYVVPKRRQLITFFLYFLTLEYWTDTLSRNVGKVLLSSLTSWPLRMGPIRCPETSVNNNFLFGLYPWGWDRYVVPKRRWRITTGRCVVSQKSADLECKYVHTVHKYVVSYGDISLPATSLCRQLK
jgi:hypothetical protein